ncbi:MAG: hypothetical protein SFV23_02945 [Planctomycetaceae bacterium]|nr:hypothetical protein [Planctomycetaceae bacterium]
MSAPTPIEDFQCPKCDAEVQADWACCPKCGTWLRSDGPFSYRVLAWLAVAVAFVSATALLSRNSPETATVFAVIFGLPLCYTFGKAVWFRATGRPLTYRDLGLTSVRAFAVNAGLFIVLPTVVGVALVVLMFAVCVGALATGQL